MWETASSQVIKESGVAESDKIIMSGTGGGLVAFLESRGQKGVMPKAMAQNYRLASEQVLQAVFDEDWETTDVKDADVTDVWKRFVNLKAGAYSPASFSAYKSRFTTAVTYYREFIQDPAGWRPPLRTRTKVSGTGGLPAKRKRPTHVAATKPETAREVEATTQLPGPTFIPHTFPLRAQVRATLNLPEDLTGHEAKRLANFIESLAVDEEQPALPPARSGGDAA